jgi:hypothetical protein
MKQVPCHQESPLSSQTSGKRPPNKKKTAQKWVVFFLMRYSIATPFKAWSAVKKERALAQNNVV